MTTLARKLRLVDYFTLGWGTMVGVGWLVVMDDWLGRGGPLGGILGFAIGGALLLPIGYVYGRLVAGMPDAAGEVAYTAKVFAQPASFATGWMMVLAYFAVCPWEAVAVGRIASYIFPSLDSIPLYRIAGRPVYLPHLVIGLGLTVLLTLLNFRGIRLSATFQNWTTFGTIALFLAFVGFGVSKGAPQNFPPVFTHGGFVSVLLVMQIVPYFMTGFESVVKGAEEASPEFQARSFLKVIWMAIIVGILFYTVVIGAVAYVGPWKQLIGENFMTAVVFERAVGSRWIVRVILAAALLSLLKVFNGNFVASSRLLFAMGRRGFIDSGFATIHPRTQTPAIAVLCVGVATGACMFLGDAILVPITEVASAASAFGWLATCAAFYAMRPPARERWVAVVGVTVGLLMLLMKIVPAVPGSFSGYEWLALAVWGSIGLGLAWRDRKSMKSVKSV
ncbi:MAG TPA: APC family permease [Terriglobales bacterium]|jgi:amino acid transporter|nr:APC family permease [Terriglobales bacterium]